MSTIIEMNWPSQIENGALLRAADDAAFDVLLTSDQNIPYQQDLSGRRLALVILGSNIWPVVRTHVAAINAAVDGAVPGSYRVVEMPLPKKPQRRSPNQ